jgi:hypothetical protein
MAAAARDRLARLLLGDARSAFSAQLTARPEDLSLEVAGYGRVVLPVTPARARKLAGLGEPARFGRGEQTLTDTGVRDTWEIPSHLVRADWDSAVLADVLATVRDELGCPGSARLSAELHSLLVYEPGQFFLPHQDSEKSDDMVATLVVTLPSGSKGGELVVAHNGEQKSYAGSKTAISLVAFYADCRHEVLPVTSGCRVTLTYNLLLHGDPSRPAGEEGTVTELAGLLREHFGTPAPRYYGGPPGSPPGRLVYLLDHEYTPRSLAWPRLKGADGSRASLLRAAADRAGCEAILALADVKETYGAYPADDVYGYRRGWHDDDYYDEEDDSAPSEEAREYATQDLEVSEITLTHWTGPDGARLEQTSLFLREAEVCASTPSGDLAPYSQQYEGYMGNWGNTLDRWYHRAAVVLWPRENAFANRAETSPAWALDELVAVASSGDVASARAAAADLVPFWDAAVRGQLAWHERGRAAGLLGKALRAAQAVADPVAATALLGPFRIDGLAAEHVKPLAKIAERYGERWTADLLRTWFGAGEPAQVHVPGSDLGPWARQLPGLCTRLHAAGAQGTAAARRLLDLAWEQIAADIGAALASSPPSYRDRQLGDLGEPLAAVLTASTAIGARGTPEAVAAYLTQQHDAVTVLEMSALRAGSATPAKQSAGDGDFRVLAGDCAARLRSRLARPARQPGDWSIALHARGCACGLCGTLRAFLADQQERTLHWPLAQKGRQHVHQQIDRAELPVTHVTRREGRPYTLVLTKTGQLFGREQEARAADEADLAWLASKPEPPPTARTAAAP